MTERDTRPPALRLLIDTLAAAIGSGCPSGCMKNAVMCRIFQPDSKLDPALGRKDWLKAAQDDPCQCWCHGIHYTEWLGVVG